jgi:hypothetical protein
MYLYKKLRLKPLSLIMCLHKTGRHKTVSGKDYPGANRGGEITVYTPHDWRENGVHMSVWSALTGDYTKSIQENSKRMIHFHMFIKK